MGSSLPAWALGFQEGDKPDLCELETLCCIICLSVTVHYRRLEARESSGPGRTRPEIGCCYPQRARSASSFAKASLHASFRRTVARKAMDLSGTLMSSMNKNNFANKIHLFANFRRFFAKWGLFFAKWGLLFARSYVRKSPAVLLNLGHLIAPLHFVCAI